MRRVRGADGALAWGIAALLACAATSARAESVAIDLARRVFEAQVGAQEDEVRARLRVVEQRVDDLLVAAELLLAGDPIEAAQVDASVMVGGGIDGGRAGAEASVQLTAHLDSATCRTVWVSVLARGRTATALDGRARASGEAAAGVCFPSGIDLTSLFALPIPLVGFPLRVEGHAALQRTPSLTAARSALREPYSELGWAVAMEGVRYLRGRERTRWIAAPGVSVAVNRQWRGFPTGDSARLEVVLDTWFMRFHRRRPPLALADRSIDVFAIGAHGVRDDNGAAVIDFWPVRLTGLGVGAGDRVLVDLSVGGSGPGTLTVNDEPLPTTGLPQVDIVAAHLALYAGTSRSSLALGFDSTLDTNLLAELVHESRGHVTLRRGEGRLRLEAAAYGGRAIHYFDATTRGAERMIGASLDASYALSAHTSAGLALSAAQSFGRDAVLDERGVPGSGIRALLTLAASYPLYQGKLVPVRSLRPGFLRGGDAPAPAPAAPAPE